MKAARFLIIVAFFAFAPATGAAETFVSHYEPLHGTNLRTADYLGADGPSDRRAARVVLSFEVLGQRFDLDLEPNDRVLAALPQNAAFAGLSVYRGRLADNPDSWVRIVMSDGMPRGLVWDGARMYAIEAPGDSVVAISEPVMYRLSDLNILPGTMSCGAMSISGNAAKVYGSLKGEWAEASSQAAGATTEVTLSVLGDAQFTEAMGGDAAAAAAITTRFNNVDGYFSEQVGVHLNVEHIETYDNATDPFDDTLDSRSLLDQLSELRLQTPALRSRGLTHLYTGRDISENTVGIAWRGGLCDSYFSAGLSEGRRGPTTDSLIAAHEIGHNFNAEHDGEEGTPCAAEPETFIMAPRVNGSQEFSACSIAVMQAEAAGARCVTPLPAVDVGIRRVTQLADVLLGAATSIEYEVFAAGTLEAANAVADFALPAVLLLDSVTSTSGDCTSGAGTASCELGNIAGQDSETVTLHVTPVAVGSGTLRASVSTSGNDERLANDQDSLPLTVDPAVDLVVNPPATSPAFIDARTTVTVRLENRSNLDATAVSLSVTVARGLRVDSASWPLGGCSVSAQRIDCQANRFAAQSSASLNINATAMALGLQNVSATISAAEIDVDTANNSASRSVNVAEPQVETDSGGGGTTSPLLLMLLALAAARRRLARQRG
jgi:hypothetical protein